MPREFGFPKQDLGPATDQFYSALCLMRQLAESNLVTVELPLVQLLDLWLWSFCTYHIHKRHVQEFTSLWPKYWCTAFESASKEGFTADFGWRLGFLGLVAIIDSDAWELEAQSSGVHWFDFFSFLAESWAVLLLKRLSRFLTYQSHNISTSCSIRSCNFFVEAVKTHRSFAHFASFCSWKPCRHLWLETPDRLG